MRLKVEVGELALKIAKGVGLFLEEGIAYGGQA